MSSTILRSILIAVILSGCATMAPQTKKVLSDKTSPEKVLLTATPFVPQDDGDCGPGAMAMLLQDLKIQKSLDEMRPHLLTPGQRGTLPTDMIRYSRQQGLLAIPVNDLNSIIHTLDQGRPVVVLQNLGFSWFPRWHYAVVTGYDKNKQEFYLHSGTDKFTPMPMTYFERHWQLAQYWAVFLAKPTEKFSHLSELSFMQAASGLEAAGQLVAAEKAYQTALSLWPQSLTALIGLGNIAFINKNYSQSVQYLKRAVKAHPLSAEAKNNLEVASAHVK